jgi:putative endonuclease
MDTGGYMYILASKGKRLYVGVTAQLQIRVSEHRARKDPNSFTARYNIDLLVYYEAFASIGEAIARKSEIKNMHRLEKIQLIVSVNPEWRDLSAEWGKPMQPFDESKMRPPVGF